MIYKSNPSVNRDIREPLQGEGVIFIGGAKTPASTPLGRMALSLEDEFHIVGCANFPFNAPLFIHLFEHADLDRVGAHLIVLAAVPAGVPDIVQVILHVGSEPLHVICKYDAARLEEFLG